MTERLIPLYDGDRIIDYVPFVENLPFWPFGYKAGIGKKDDDYYVIYKAEYPDERDWSLIISEAEARHTIKNYGTHELYHQMFE